MIYSKFNAPETQVTTPLFPFEACVIGLFKMFSRWVFANKTTNIISTALKFVTLRRT